MRKAANRGNAPTSQLEDDYDGKGKKISHQRLARTKNTILFLAVFCLVGIAALYAFRDSTDFHPFSDGYLRARALKSRYSRSMMQDANDIPYDSIYRLTVNDANGEPFALDQFSGSVSLVVNVACK